MVYKAVSFDGLSLAGKSTMVQMLSERSEDAEVVRENTYDRFRPVTSKLNKLLKELNPTEAVEKVSEEYSDFKPFLMDALNYSLFEDKPTSQKQALLAYMFTQGRKTVDDYVRKAIEKHDVILDRWKISGMAYQVDPEGYGWQEIRDLNDVTFDILTPDVQIILTCPIGQIPIRRAFRDKQPVGTAGQMSKGREHIILPAFKEIFNAMKSETPVYMFENCGTPMEDVKEQIKQAIPIFQQIENVVGKHGFRIKQEKIDDAEAFWLEPERLRRIYERQTK